MMELARMTSKGQLTVPVSIRKKLGIGTGDQLLFYERDGQVIIAPVTPASLADAQAATFSIMSTPLMKFARLLFLLRSATSSGGLRFLAPTRGVRQPRKVILISGLIFLMTLACSV